MFANTLYRQSETFDVGWGACQLKKFSLVEEIPQELQLTVAQKCHLSSLSLSTSLCLLVLFLFPNGGILTFKTPQEGSKATLCGFRQMKIC